MKKVLNFINGEYVEPQSGQWIDNYDPSTGEVYSQVADSSDVDVVMAIQAASKAFPAWSAMPVTERNQILFNHVMSTKMACADTDVEQRFSKIIANKTLNYRMEGLNLILENDTEKLLFTKGD